jgi:hypothetical protein
MGELLSLGTRAETFQNHSPTEVWVFPSRNSARTEAREGSCLRSPCRSRPCTGDRQLGFWGAFTRLPEHPSGKHLLLPGIFISYGMTREFGQGSRSSERKGGYDQFISLLFYIFRLYMLSISTVSYIAMNLSNLFYRIIS